MNNVQSVRRWVYIINVIRAIPYTTLDGFHLEVDGQTLRLKVNDDVSLDVVEATTDERLITFEEDGWPKYRSEWAECPVEWDCYDYPMYEVIEQCAN